MEGTEYQWKIAKKKRRGKNLSPPRVYPLREFWANYTSFGEDKFIRNWKIELSDGTIIPFKNPKYEFWKQKLAETQKN